MPDTLMLSTAGNTCRKLYTHLKRMIFIRWLGDKLLLLTQIVNILFTPPECKQNNIFLRLLRNEILAVIIDGGALAFLSLKRLNMKAA